MQILKNIFFCLVALLLAAACKRSPEAPKSPGAFTAAGAGEDPYTYEEIQESGELIVATISGPDTYFEYQGRGMGLQFAYAEAYAVAEGLRLRVELAQDTLALYEMLRQPCQGFFLSWLYNQTMQNLPKSPSPLLTSAGRMPQD